MKWGAVSLKEESKHGPLQVRMKENQKTRSGRDGEKGGREFHKRKEIRDEK